MSAFLRAVPLSFGALYGFLPAEKRNSRDLYKFVAIMGPMASVAAWAKSTATPVQYPGTNFVASMIVGPVMIGWWACIGSATGRMAKKVLEDS